MLMTYTGEKMMLGVTSVSGGFVAAIGAIFTEGEAKWLCVTLAISIVVASFLALVFKRADETIKVVVGRCGLSLIGGIFGTRYLLHTGVLKIVDNDMILLASQAAGVTIASFLIGYPLLQIINANGKTLADKIFSRWAPKIDGEK